MRRWWANASFVLALGTACVSTEGLLSNDGSDGGVDANAPDGSGVVDASSDAPTIDVATDGAAEAGVGCAVLETRMPAPRFCDDLDRSDAGVASWPISDLADGGVLERVDTFGFSAPASLHAKTPSATSNDYRQAYVRRNRPGTVDRVRYELDAFFPNAPATTGSFIAFANIHFTSATLSYLDVRLEADKLAGGAVTARLQQTIEGSSNEYIDTPLTDPLPIGRWFHVVIDVDLKTSPAKAKVMFDGALQADVQLETVYVPTSVGISFGIRVGTAKGGITGSVDGWEAYFDNAAVY